MAKKLKSGDHVEWETRQGTTQGTVKKKLTKTTKVKGHTAKATEDDPQFLVESDKTGAEAAHKPESLKKKSTTSKKSDSDSSKKSSNTTSKKSDNDDAETYKEFKEAVNMTRKQLEKWLETDDSKNVGRKKDREESVGHGSGRKIVAILGKKKAELDKDDYKHMRKVVGYIQRHKAQEPDGDTKQTRWRYSLKNWGHDPEKG